MNGRPLICCASIALIFTSVGCIDVPAAEGEPQAEGDAALELGLDGGAMRPPTGMQYSGPQCASASVPQGAEQPFVAASDGGSAADIPPDSPAFQAMQGHAGTASTAQAGSVASVSLGEGSVLISELMSNPGVLRDDDGEWIELYNPSPADAVDLAGCALDDGASMHPIPNGPALPALGYATLARSDQVAFAPDRVLSFSLGNESDSVALVCAGVVIDRVSYGTGFPLAVGASMALDPGAIDATANDRANAWCLGRDGTAGDLGTPGTANPACNTDEADAG